MSTSSITQGGEILYFYAFTLVFSMQFTIAPSLLLSVNRDQSVSQAWASCHGGQIVSCNQSLLRRKSFRWMFGALWGPAGAHCSSEAE